MSFTEWEWYCFFSFFEYSFEIVMFGVYSNILLPNMAGLNSAAKRTCVLEYLLRKICDCMEEGPVCCCFFLPLSLPFVWTFKTWSMCLLFCFVYFEWMLCCYVWKKKKKNVNHKKNKLSRQHRSRYPKSVYKFKFLNVLASCRQSLVCIKKR